MIKVSKMKYTVLVIKIFPSLFKASTNFALKEQLLSASLAGDLSRKQTSENTLGATTWNFMNNLEISKGRGDINSRKKWRQCNAHLHNRRCSSKRQPSGETLPILKPRLGMSKSETPGEKQTRLCSALSNVSTHIPTILIPK